MIKQVFNPYLQSWEFVLDGEPHVFDDGFYIYDSHDLANGWAFCLGEYVCWSCPKSNLKTVKWLYMLQM